MGKNLINNRRYLIILTVFLLFSTGTALPITEVSSARRLVCCIENDIVDMIQQVNESLVFYYHDNLMSFGPRYTGSENCTLAGQYIHNEFEEMGLNVEFHNWKYGGFECRNVVATLNGSDPTSNAVFIMSAHYDCTPNSLGADDDGSGVAAVLATAKIMSQHSFNYTIRFVTFSGEEVGTYGSFCYARDAYGRGDNIVAVINADMIGYANTTDGGKILRFSYPERSAWVADFAKTIGEKYMDMIDLSVELIPNHMGADHQAFVDYGYDGVWVVHHDNYLWANSPDDIPDHINWTYQVKATKLLLAVMAEISIKPIDVQVILRTPYEGYGYFFNYPIVPLSLGKYWGAGLRGITVILGRAVASVDVISDEKIEYVIFCIDGNFLSWDSKPPYEWKIQGKYCPLIGRHNLKVYAYTESGKVAADEMDVVIFTLSCGYCKW